LNNLTINDIIKSGNTKSFQTFQIPKEEYSMVNKVMNSLDYPVEYRNKKFFELPLSNGFRYIIENNGYGNFRILGKSRIDATRFYD